MRGTKNNDSQYGPATGGSRFQRVFQRVDATCPVFQDSEVTAEDMGVGRVGGFRAKLPVALFPAESLNGGCGKIATDELFLPYASIV
jgi:hypothetical protein